MRSNPGGILKSGLIGTLKKRALFARFEDLLNQSGFANLSWPGYHLKKSSWFGKPLGEGRGLGSFVGVHDFTQCVELIYSMY